MITLLLALSAFAAESPLLEITFLQKKVEFVTDEKSGLTVSAGCRNGDKLDCEAVRKLSDLSWKNRPKNSPNNPSSDLCKKQLNGTVVIGLTAQKDEMSFCRFADGSMIDGGSLVQRARENDK